MMIISNHGGKCCGVKHIYGLDVMLGGYEPPLTAHSTTLPRPDSRGIVVKSDDNFFRDDAPQETPRERFIRYMSYLSRYRPKGVVECITMRSPATTEEAVAGEPPSYANSQYRVWHPFLLEQGFREVTKCLNSNSSNFIHIYHYITIF